MDYITINSVLLLLLISLIATVMVPVYVANLGLNFCGLL